jgi:hypothetical protein
MTTLLRAELHLVPIFGPFLSPLKLQPTRFAHTWRITILSFRHSTHAHRVRRNPKLKKELRKLLRKFAPFVLSPIFT